MNFADSGNPVINLIKGAKLGQANWPAFYAHKSLDRPDEAVLETMADTMSSLYGQECDTDAEAVKAFMAQFRFLLDMGTDGWYILESMFIDLLTALGLTVKGMPLMFAPAPIQEAMKAGIMWVGAHAEEFAKWDHGDGEGFTRRAPGERESADEGEKGDRPCPCEMCAQDRNTDMSEDEIRARRNSHLQRLMNGESVKDVLAEYADAMELDEYEFDREGAIAAGASGATISDETIDEVRRHHEDMQHTVNDLDTLPPIGNDI